MSPIYRGVLSDQSNLRQHQLLAFGMTGATCPGLNFAEKFICARVGARKLWRRTVKAKEAIAEVVSASSVCSDCGHGRASFLFHSASRKMRLHDSEHYF